MDGVESECPECPEYPEDLRLALERVADVARPFPDAEIQALRAALSIALGHLAAGEQELPEVHVMVAEEQLVVDEDRFWGRTVEPGELYLVCPVCGGGGEFCLVSPGAEYANLYELQPLESSEGDPYVVSARPSDADFHADGMSMLSHQSNWCYARLELPEWFDLTYL